MSDQYFQSFQDFSHYVLHSYLFSGFSNKMGTSIFFLCIVQQKEIVAMLYVTFKHSILLLSKIWCKIDIFNHVETRGRLNFPKWFGDNGPIIAKSFGEI